MTPPSTRRSAPRSLRRGARSISLAALSLVAALLPLLSSPPAARANAGVLAATGGTGLVVGTYQSLAGPGIGEGDSGEIGVGTFTLEAPDGFEFDASRSVTAQVVSFGDCTPSQRTLQLDGGTSQTVTPSRTSITVNVTRASRNDCRAAIGWTGVRVKATAIGTGQITKGGSSTVAGVTDGVTSFAALSATGAPATTTRTPTVTATATVTSTATRTSSPMPTASSTETPSPTRTLDPAAQTTTPVVGLSPSPSLVASETPTPTPQAGLTTTPTATPAVTGSATATATLTATAAPGTLTPSASATARVATATPTATAVTTPAPRGPASVAFSPATGATLASGDGSLVLAIPGGAVDQSATFNYAELAPPAPVATDAGGRLQFTRSFRLTAAATTDGAAITQFATPLQLTIRYTLAELAGAGIASPDMLRLYYQDGAGAWIRVPATVDAAARTLTAALDHFTVFAVGGETFETAGSTGALYFTDDLSDAAAWQFSSGNGSVAGNTMTTSGTGNGTDAFTITNSDELTDFTWQARVRVNVNSNNIYSGLMFRWQSVNDYYALVINPGADQFILAEINGGTPNTRGIQAVTINVSPTWYWLRVTMSGNVVTGLLMADAGGAPGATLSTINYTDPSPIASGRAGIGNFNLGGLVAPASFQSPTLTGTLPQDWGGTGITQVTGHTGMMWNNVTAAAPTPTPSGTAGTRSIQLYSGDIFNEGYTAQNSAAVIPDTTYDMRGWIRTNNVSTASSGATIIAREAPSGVETTIGFVAGTTGWTQYSTTFTTRSDTTSVTVRVQLKGSGTANFDNIAVSTIGTPTPTPAGTLVPTATPTPVPGSAALYGVAQSANSGITNAANSIVMPQAFDGALASKAFNGATTSNWTWTNVEDTTLTSVTAARIEVRWYQSGWTNDTFRLQYSVDGGTIWNTLATYQTGNAPPAVITTSSFTGLETVITTPALANALQLRFIGAGAGATANDAITLYVDQVRLIVSDSLPTSTPTPTLTPTITLTPTATSVPVGENLFGQSPQTANSAITNSANSQVPPQAFDDVVAQKAWNGATTSFWTWTSVEDTTLGSIATAQIRVRFRQAGWVDDVFSIQYSVNGGGTWNTLVQYQTGTPPPTTLTTVSFTGLETVITTPALANAVQIRFVGAGAGATANDAITLYVDQVSLVVTGQPATATPTSTYTPTNTPTATATNVPGVVVTPATGGTTISQDTNPVYGSGAWTTLSGPRMEERATGDMIAGRTIVLTAPSGFQFNTGSAATATVALLAGSLGSCFTLGAPAMAATTITFTVTAADAPPGSGYCRVTFGSIQVRPTAGSPLASGDITNAGTQLPNGATNYGTLTEVQGTITGWNSYEPGCSVARSSFDATNNTICVKGTAPVTTAGYYRVVFYDGAGALVIDDGGKTGSPTLQSGDHVLTACCSSAAPGTWHAVVYPNAVAPEASYAGTSQEIRANKPFTVSAAALPALPTPLSALIASGGAGALYALFRRRLFRGRA